MSTINVWGIALITIGVSLVIKTVFNLDFSIFRILVAALFLYFGLKILLGHSDFLTKDAPSQAIFAEKTFTTIENGKEYNVIFGSGKFKVKKEDLKLPAKIQINTIFGGSELEIADSIPVSIQSQTVLGGTKLPNGNSSAFGDLNYKSEQLKDSATLVIETNTIFGGIHIKRVP